MAKQRKYEISLRDTGLAFGVTGCAPDANLANPNVTNTSSLPGIAFSAGPARTLTNVQLHLIFWGAWWNANPFALEVSGAVTRLLAGPYMTYLAQYGLGRANIHGTTFASDSEPGFFSFGSVGSFIKNLLTGSRVPEPDDQWPMVYAVIMPTNASFQGAQPYDKKVPVPAGTVSGILGENGKVTWVDFNDPSGVEFLPAYFFWVGNNGTDVAGLDYITTVLSHELVELATDPNGADGIRRLGPPQLGGQPVGYQIGDVCQNWCDYVRGVKAQSYWSQLDGNCVLPKVYSVRRTLYGKSIGGKIPRPMPSANAWITSQF
jgi:hypothetical protein